MGGHPWDAAAAAGGAPAAFALQPPLQTRASATSVAVPPAHHHHYSPEWDGAHPSGGGRGADGGAGVGGGGGAGGPAAGLGLPPILQVPSDSLSQLELMLEGVYHHAAETVVHVVELSRALRSKTELVTAQQSTHRNILLSLSLRLSVLTVSISSASLITSALGMNLASGLDGSSPPLFWAAVGASLGAGAATYRAFDRLMSSSNPATAYAKRLNAFQDLLYKLDVKLDQAQSTMIRVAGGGRAAGAAAAAGSPAGAGGGGGGAAMDAAAFDDSASFLTSPRGGPPPGAPPTSGVRLSKEAFRSLHEKTTGRPVSDEEAEMLFELLDSDSDGQLRLEEALTTLGGGGAGGPGTGGVGGPAGGGRALR